MVCALRVGNVGLHAGDTVSGSYEMVTIRLPDGLAKYCDGQRTVELAVTSVAGALDELVQRFPAVGSRLMEEDGRVRGHLMVLCNDRAVAVDTMATRKLVDGDELAVLFLAGGG